MPSRPEPARHLGDDAGDHHQHHERRADLRDQREGKVNRRVGGDVGYFVQHRAGGRGLLMLLGHDAVDGR
jgi:hypothetical protein